MEIRGLGLLSIATIVITAAIPVLGKPLDWRDSVSHTWAGSQRRRLVMGIAMSVAGTGMCASLAFWVVPHYHLPGFMYGIIAIAYAAFLAVAWVPMHDRPGEHSYRHGHFLGGSVLATLAIAAMAMVVWSGVNVPPAAWLACCVAMILAACWPLLFFRPARRLFLLLESLIALTFSLALGLLLIG